MKNEGLSEADLLTEMLGLLDDHGTFTLGMLMGVMSKGHLDHISRLKVEIKSLKDICTSLDATLESYEQKPDR